MSTSRPAPVEVALRTDPGRDPTKQVNEDACADEVTPFGHLVVVCDGMGGHAGGREASELGVRVIRESLAERAACSIETPPRDALAAAIRDANRRIFSMTSPEESGTPGRPGSTVVAILVHSEGTEIAHVGDSRAYLIHAGQISQLTKDHSMVQRLVDDHVLSPEEAAHHPEANKILRALGIREDVDVETRPEPLPHVAGDTLVLCTDGLSDLLTAPDILQVAEGAPAPQAAGILVDLANARGGHDNVTVAIVRPKESAVRLRTNDVAPTIVQTAMMPAMAPASPPVAPTLVESGRTLPPPSPRAAHGRSGSRAAMFVGVLVALVGLAVAAFVAYTHLDERRGKRHRHLDAGMDPLLLAPHPSGSADLTPNEAPSSPPIVAVDTDAAIEPLAPAVDAGRRRRAAP